MITVGMDVHKDNTVFDLFDPEADERVQHRHVTVATTAAGIRSVLEPLKGDCQLAFEVGTQAQWVASIVRPLVSRLEVANPSQIPWLFRDGRKNDKLDSRKLATLLHLGQLPTVHLPAEEVSAWRSLINHRRGIVKRQTILKNQIRSLLRTFNHRCPHRSCWTKAGRAWLAALPFDSIRKVLADQLYAELKFVEASRLVIERKLGEIAETNPNVALLRTIPGIGPRTAEAIVAYADNVRRFPSRKHFASYFGLTPTEDSSGQVVRHGHISKRGPSVVRWVLVEATHQVIKHCPAMQTFFDRIHQGKKSRYKRAIVATARKLLSIAFGMLRDKTAFDEMRVFVSPR